eukprot:12112394-Alexandrium_andersonii.AAC.1
MSMRKAMTHPPRVLLPLTSLSVFLGLGPSLSERKLDGSTFGAEGARGSIVLQLGSMRVVVNSSLHVGAAIDRALWMWACWLVSSARLSEW